MLRAPVRSYAKASPMKRCPLSNDKNDQANKKQVDDILLYIYIIYIIKTKYKTKQNAAEMMFSVFHSLLTGFFSFFFFRGYYH